MQQPAQDWQFVHGSIHELSDSLHLPIHPLLDTVANLVDVNAEDPNLQKLVTFPKLMATLRSSKFFASAKLAKLRASSAEQKDPSKSTTLAARLNTIPRESLRASEKEELAWLENVCGLGTAAIVAHIITEGKEEAGQFRGCVLRI